MAQELVRFGCQKFKFSDLEKQSKLVRSVQRKIDREIYCDEKGGMHRLGHELLFRMKKAAGFDAKTLEELFNSEKQIVGDLWQYLVSLHDFCEEHYTRLSDFQQGNETKIKACLVTTPSYVKKRREKVKEYHDAMERIQATRRDNPAYLDLRRRVRDLNKEISDLTGDISASFGNYGIRNHLLDNVDSTAALLAFGKNKVKVIASAYEVVLEYLEKAVDSVEVTRNLWKNADRLYSLNEGISNHLVNAGNLEGKLFDVRVLDIAPNSSFPGDDKVIDFLDDVNERYGNRGLRYLTR
jgi:hypothetical protein